MKGKAERKIIINHSGSEEACDIRLKLLKLIARATQEDAEFYGDRESEQYRDIRQNKQR